MFDIGRRDFIRGLAGTALLWPYTAVAQQAGREPPRIGVFLFGTPENEPNLGASRRGLRDLGYVESQNVVRTIPIVFATSNDPVQGGLMASLSHLGGNMTGVTFISSDLAAKRLQFLNEIAPSLKRVAVIWNPDHIDPEYRETQLADKELGVDVQSLEVRAVGDLMRHLDLPAKPTRKH